MSPQRCLRTDAARNRDRIIDAAHEAFAEQGLDVSMNEIARRAGVGIATLYRRFATRDELITATFAQRMTAFADSVEAALADPDPWHGFCAHIEGVCAMQADDPGFTRVLTLSFPMEPEFEAERDRAFRSFVKLIKRAKDAGRLRADFSPHDLAILLMANAGVVTATAADAPGAWRRLVAYMLQAFEAPGGHPLPPAPSSGEIRRAMQVVHRPRG